MFLCIFGIFGIADIWHCIFGIADGTCAPQVSSAITKTQNFSLDLVSEECRTLSNQKSKEKKRVIFLTINLKAEEKK